MDKPKNNKILFILILLATLISSHSVRCDNTNGDDKLAEFTTRTLIQTYWLHGDDDPQQKLEYELEETYDKSRGLAKLVAQKADGYRWKLYVRHKDNFYLEAQIDSEGNLHQCNVSKGIHELGFFGSYARLSQALAKSKPQDQLIVGPSAILAKFSDKLKARWLVKSLKEKPNANSNLTNHGDRLVLGQETLNFTIEGNGGQVEFWQPDYMIDRSPLLSEMAVKFLYTSQIGEVLQVDYLSIDRVNHNLETLRDPFKLPAGLSCYPSSVNQHQEPVSEPNKLLSPSSWANRLILNSDTVSANLHGLNNYLTDIKWTLDLGLRMFALELPGIGHNVFDLHNKLLYHLPEEPAISVKSNDEDERETKTENNPEYMQLRNLECSIISSASSSIVPEQAGLFYSSLGYSSIDRWRYLVGDMNNIMYLGKTKYASERPAHEFELEYSNSWQLPIYILVLLNQEMLNGISEPNNRLIAKLWLAIEEDCTDLYDDKTICEDPQLLGFRLNDGALIEIKFNEFLWESDVLDSGRSLAEAFDISYCPVENLKLSLHVGWSSLERMDAQKTNGLVLTLDELVADELINYLDAFGASSRIFLQRISRHQFNSQHQTLKSEHYLVEIAQIPTKAIAFHLAANGRPETREKMLGKMIDSLGPNLARSPLECLTWASQFATNSLAVLYSSTKGCLLYDSADRKSRNVVELAPKDENLFWLYVQGIESLVGRDEEDDNCEDELDTFKSSELNNINKHIMSQIATATNISALVDEKTLAKDVRFGLLKLAPDHTEMEAQTSSGGLRISSILNGYRFVEKSVAEEDLRSDESRKQSEVLSLGQCANLCHSNKQCATYSHCKLSNSGHEFCQLSNWDIRTSLAGNSAEVAQATLAANLTRDGDCSIYEKDYLYYYDAESRGAVWQSGQSNWFSLVSPPPEGHVIVTLNECARTCWTKFEQICLEFAFRSSGKSRKKRHESISCYLYLDGEMSDEDGKLVDRMQPNNISGKLEGHTLYKRRAITLFRRTISGSFEWAATDTFYDQFSTTLSGLSADQCAHECLSRDSVCVSFDSCQVYGAGDDQSLQDIECVLLNGSALDHSMRMLDGPSANRKVKRKCAHYETSARTEQISQDNLALILGYLAASSSSNATQQSQQQRSSSVLSYLGSLFGASCLGLALGIGANALVVWRKSKPHRGSRMR